MSFFNDKFLTEVSNYEYKKSYEKDSLVLYNNHIYIAKKDTNEEIIPETTTDDWEYISYEDCINIIANIGSFTGDSYLGTKKYPFMGTVLQNSIQILQKNKVNRPGYFSNIKFGKDIVDDNNATNLGVLYDTDNENPKLIAMTNVLNEVDLGTGQFCFNNIYSSSPNITISDDNKIAYTKDINTDDYVNFFMSLTPKGYILTNENGTSGRMHIGFAATDVEKALKENNLSPDDFAPLVKIPVLKKDLYVDHSINDLMLKRFHYEDGEEVSDEDENEHVTGESLIRYIKLPIYRKNIGYFVFKNYPINPNTETNDDATIIVKELELIPFDKNKKSLKINFNKARLKENYNDEFECRSNMEVLEDESLKITFTGDKLSDPFAYITARISLNDVDAEKAYDLSKYEYLRIVSDYKRPYLIGFDEFQSSEENTAYHPYQTNEFGDFYCYSQDDQFSVESYIYALRYDEFIALNTMMIQNQQKQINEMKTEILNIKSEIKNLR